MFRQFKEKNKKLLRLKLKSEDKNTSLKLPVGVSPLQLVNLHRNRRYFVIKLHSWFVYHIS
jgi:hypothetical protein